MTLDWGTRRKPVGAIVAWGSLAIFAVLTILGIAGLVMGLQPQPTASASIETAMAEPEPAPVLEERLPQELSFADAKAAEAETPAVTEPAVQVAEAPVVDKGDAVIASTFEQLVKPVVVPASDVPEGAVATVQEPATAAPAETAVASTGADSQVELPMGKEEAVAIATRPRVAVARNAAAWAIESEVPDGDHAKGTALGYAAQPEDDEVRVGDSSINVRSGPSQDNKRLFALAAGAEVDVEGKANGWVSITDAKGREGWVDATLLENLDLDAVPVVKDPPAAEPEKPADQRVVAGSGVTVRAGPGKSNKQLFALSSGSEVTVLDDSKGWLKIKDAKGRTGWAYQSYMK
jgi:SH3-like domain-containing protein